MNIFKFFSGLWNKLIYVINLIYAYAGPIYPEVVSIIKAVQTEGLKDDVARKAVFQRVIDIIHTKGLKQIPDSMLNTIIEVIYQLVKAKKE